MRYLGLGSLVLILWAGISFGAQLSGNIVVGGDFESVNAIKMLDLPRTQAELDALANPVCSWQFHPAGIAAEDAGGYTIGQHFDDCGNWIGAWGIGTVDNRNDATGGGRDNNVSLVNRDGSNTHVLDGVKFRSWAAQVVKAPANHVRGQAIINFDYYFNQWEDMSVNADSIFHVWVGGLNSLPTWGNRAGPHLRRPAGRQRWRQRGLLVAQSRLGHPQLEHAVGRDWPELERHRFHARPFSLLRRVASGSVTRSCRRR